MARKGRLQLALDRSLRALTLQPEDDAVVALAREYTAAIDADGQQLVMLGKNLRETLIELGMTPRARAAMFKGEPEKPATSPIDELRARRQKRSG